MGASLLTLLALTTKQERKRKWAQVSSKTFSGWSGVAGLHQG